MPSLPKPRLRRAARERVASARPTAEPHVEVVTLDGSAGDGKALEGEGLRWINIPRPGPADRAWLEEHLDFHPLDLEDVYSRNQRPKIDEYPGTSSSSCTSRPPP